MVYYGHEEKVRAFKKLVSEDSFGHAYLFFGEGGVGKMLFAKSLGYFLEFGKFEILEEPLIDFLAISPDEKGTIGVAKVAELKNFLWQTPFRSERRLAIIDGSEGLTNEAQSAILKITEDSPRHATLIFIAHNQEVLLPPLLSRLAKIYFPRFKESEIEKILVSRFGVSVKDAKVISGKSLGRIGRAIDIVRDKKEKMVSVSDANNLEVNLEKEILKMFLENPLKHSEKLSRMLERETLLKRFNLNQKLQEKAINFEIG